MKPNSESRRSNGAPRELTSREAEQVAGGLEARRVVEDDEKVRIGGYGAAAYQYANETTG